MEHKKDKILFIPFYIGNLKYFEKLVPHLGKNYEASFLFLPVPAIAAQNKSEMILYCQRRKYGYRIMDDFFLPTILKKIPFLYPLMMSYDYRKKVKKFLQESHIKKIISANDVHFYMNCLFNEAHKTGVATMVLQWSIMYKRESTLQKTLESKWMRLYHHLSQKLIEYVSVCHVRNLKIWGGGNAQRFGVINKQAYDMFKEAGVSEEKMSIVGYLDFHLAKQTYERLSNSRQERDALTEQYGINPRKKNIVLYSNPFNMGGKINTPDINVFTDEQQLLYYQKIVQLIREVFDESEADILFKIHPIEDIGLYKPLENHGVKLYGKDTNNENLIYFADLYIAHYSTANLIAIAMKKEAIFINLIKLKTIELAREYLSIKKFTSSEAEFLKLLHDYKNNKLKHQYNLDGDLIAPNSLQKIISWIN